jgi:glycosyltransferase involved in cell wall biosynthesis
MQKIALIIPCYNEALRLDFSCIDYLIQHTDACIYFANDGSKDETVSVIQNYLPLNPSRCFLIDYALNSGKANTVYQSVNTLGKTTEYDCVGYIDADFSTPPEEVVRLIRVAQTNPTGFVIGSRILLLNSGIKRKWHRHIIGRIIISLINLKFKLGIYDTQCGAKFFSKELIPLAFNKPFYTSWLFDVELFIRLKRKNLLHTGIEVPVFNWKDVDGSKLSWKSMFKIGRELWLLYRLY